MGKGEKGPTEFPQFGHEKNQISFLYINANTFFPSPIPSPSESMFLLFLIFPPKVAYINAKKGGGAGFSLEIECMVSYM